MSIYFSNKYIFCIQFWLVYIFLQAVSLIKCILFVIFTKIFIFMYTYTGYMHFCRHCLTGELYCTIKKSMNFKDSCVLVLNCIRKYELGMIASECKLNQISSLSLVWNNMVLYLWFPLPTACNKRCNFPQKSKCSFDCVSLYYIEHSQIIPSKWL